MAYNILAMAALGILLVFAAPAQAQADSAQTLVEDPGASLDSAATTPASQNAESTATAQLLNTTDTVFDSSDAIPVDTEAALATVSDSGKQDTTPDSSEQEAAVVEQQDSAFYPEGNPFMAFGQADQQQPSVDSTSEAFVLIDISRGITLSTLRAQPSDLNIGIKPGFVCDLGVRFALRTWLLAGIAIRYFETSFSIEDAYIGIDNDVRTTTNESMRFVSLPIEITAIFDLNRILPYISICVEPALFASGSYLAKERVTTTFPDRSTLVVERSYDRDISEDREQYHGFAGAGAGIEIPYGFASIYIQGSCLVGLRDIGNDSTRPLRTESRLIYFPLSAGLRFSL